MEAARIDPRTAALLRAPILPLLLRMAWPNVVVMVAQAASGLIETFWVSRLGTDALAGMALVFPAVMLMQMISAGSLGGAISSSIARALGARRTEDADALVVHALIASVAIGSVCSVLALVFGRELYAALGGRGGSLAAALAYSNVVFAGNVLLWIMNALASAVRGTGNMLVPALVVCAGVLILVPLSPVLIYGLGPFPALGIAGGGVAMVISFATGAAVLGWYVLSGRSVVRLTAVRLRAKLFGDILSVGAVATVSSVQTNVTIGVATALVASVAGPEGVAGYGTGARLEYLLIPLVFGLGAPLVALVGTNLGAGQPERALRIAFTGGAIAFALTEAIGLAAALRPAAWLSLFGHDPAMLATGSAYLRAAGPFYGFFGLGLSLYFASQGAGRLRWPLVAGFVRMGVALVGGWLAVRLTGSAGGLFVALAAGMLLYGVLVLAAVVSGSWFQDTSQDRTARFAMVLHSFGVRPGGSRGNPGEAR
ncbi:MAG TPA: MATE family efflux transporter [Candidatus Elarobacter sp.]|jgi:putative MATE family efflux protein